MRLHGGDPHNIGRRDMLRGAMLMGAGTVLSGTACSAEGDTAEFTSSNPQHALLAAFPQAVPHIGAGTPSRLPYLISDAEGIPLATLTGPVTFRVLRDGQEIVKRTAVEPRSEGVARAYVPLELTFDEPGIYDIEADYDGTSMDGVVQVYAQDEIGPPLVTQALPAVDSPTPGRTLEVDPLCTQVPPCGFHDVNLQDAVGSGKRVVLLVATPAYCRTSVCGPILENLTATVKGRGDLVVIHSEVYRNPKDAADLQTATLAPVPVAYSLTFEPVLYVTDDAGTITARADTIIDLSEMREILA